MTIDDYRQLLARVNTPWSPHANTEERINTIFMEASKALPATDFARLVDDVVTGDVFPSIARKVARTIMKTSQ